MALVALLAVHGLLLATYLVPVVSGSDDNAYHLAARLLERHGRIHLEAGDDPLAYVGRMWVQVGDGSRYFPKYPPVYPALTAAAMRLAGDFAGFLLSPLLAWSSVLAIYLLCRARGLAVDVALLGAFVMATLPLVNSFAVTQVSHATSLALVVWGYVLFFVGCDPGRRRALPLLAASGLLLGCATGVRYTDALLVLPALLWLVSEPPRGIPEEGGGGAAHRRRAGVFLAGWLLPCVVVAVYHWRAFGGPLTTAYALTEEQGGFAVSYLAQNLRLYLATLPVLLLGPVTILAALGWLVAWRGDPARRRDRRLALFHLAWIAPPLVTYLAYSWAPEGHPRSYLRFLLPLVVPGILLAMRAIDGIGGRDAGSAAWRRAAVVAVIAVQGSWGLAASLDQLELLYGFNRRVEQRVRLVEKNVAPGSVVFGELAVLDSLDYLQTYDLYWANLLDRDALAARLERTLRPGPDSLQPRRAEYLRDHLVAVDPTVYRSRVRRLIDAPLADGRAVYLVGTGATRAKLDRLAPDGYRLEKVGALPAAERPHRLFAPGQTVSRAATETGVVAEPFNIWRVRGAR